MVTVIAEHSVDLDLLPEEANILDLGARGFQFATFFIPRGHNVYLVDADNLNPDLLNFFNVAITNFNGTAFLKRDRDPQATTISDKGTESVKCMTLKDFSKMVGVPFWDCVKLDIEGSEYEVIMSLTEPPAKQLSIEFHLHTGIYTDKEVMQMRWHLEDLGYVTVQHEKTAQHGAGFNWWDSLFVLK